MKNETKHLIFLYLLGIILILFAYWCYKSFMDLPGLQNKMMGYFTTYFFGYLGVRSLLSNLKNRYLNLVLDALGFPIFVIFYLQHYIAPVITIVNFLVIYFMPTVLIIIVSNELTIIKPYLDSLLYIANLIAVITFAYFGNIIMNFTIDTSKTKFGKDLILRYSTRDYTRIYSYILMIIIYVIFNLISFSKTELFTFLPEQYVTVIKEVFVTFVAIDTLIQILITKKVKSPVRSGD